MTVVNLRPASAVETYDFGLAESRTVFPVSSRRLQIVGRDGKSTVDVDSHKAIIRANPKPDGKVEIVQLGIVGNDYKVLPNKDFFGTIEQTLRDNVRPDLLKGATVTDHVSYDGAWSKREYILPAFTTTLRHSNGFNTKLGYRVVAFNTYDGSSSAGMFTGLIDFICTNGMISGSFIGQKLRRHTSGLHVGMFADTIRESVTEVQQEVRRIEIAANTPLDLEAARKLIEGSFSERRAELLKAQLNREIGQRGMNVFALQSALTFYASHADGLFGVRNTGNDNVAKTLHERELEVQRVTHTPQFAALLKAA